MQERQGKKSLATELRQPVYIQSRTRTDDGEGGYTEAWADGSMVWAGIYPIRAMQVAEYRTLNVEASHIVKVRGDITVDQEDRVRFGSRVFEVLTVENIQERDVVKVLTCKERVDG